MEKLLSMIHKNGSSEVFESEHIMINSTNCGECNCYNDCNCVTCIVVE